MLFLATEDASVHAETFTDLEIADCVRRNFPTQSSVQNITLTSSDRLGATRDITTRIYWQSKQPGHSKYMVRVQSPEDLRGTSVLVIREKKRDDIFMYAPEIKRVRRVNAHGAANSLFGTDLSYEDIEHMRGAWEQQSTQKLEDSMIEDRPVYQLQVDTSYRESSAYSRAISFIDKQSCTPLRIELYEHGGKLRKVLTSEPSSLFKEGDSWVPRQTTIRDVRDNTQTQLHINSIEMGVPLPKRLFSEAVLIRHID